jgi:hypothetical protein
MNMDRWFEVVAIEARVLSAEMIKARGRCRAAFEALQPFQNALSCSDLML